MSFVGFDVVEVSPPYDSPGQQTALAAANIAYEMLALTAVAHTVKDQLDATIRALAPIERPPGSAGERRAAEWIADRLGGAARDAPGARRLLEADRAAVARSPRSRNRSLAALALVGLVDEIDCGSYRFRNALGRRRTAVNVIAERGDPNASSTLVVMAHHDAAQSGLVFHPGRSAGSASTSRR